MGRLSGVPFFVHITNKSLQIITCNWRTIELKWKTECLKRRPGALAGSANSGRFGGSCGTHPPLKFAFLGFETVDVSK